MQFTQEELTSATNSFAKLNVIGKGGYGEVFVAKNLRGAGTDAAVKVLNEVQNPCKKQCKHIIIRTCFCHM